MDDASETIANFLQHWCIEAVSWRCSVKNVFLEISQNSQENTSARVSCNFIEKETLAQVFSCEFCKISKNSFYYRTPLVAASGYWLKQIQYNQKKTFEVMYTKLNWYLRCCCISRFVSENVSILKRFSIFLFIITSTNTSTKIWCWLFWKSTPFKN